MSRARPWVYFLLFLSTENTPHFQILRFLSWAPLLLICIPPTCTSARASLQPWNEYQKLTGNSRAAVHVPGSFLWVSLRNETACCFLLVVTVPEENPSLSKGDEIFLRWPRVVALWKSQILKRFFPLQSFASLLSSASLLFLTCFLPKYKL